VRTLTTAFINGGYGPSNTANYLDAGTASLTNCTQNSCTVGGQDQTATTITTQNYAIWGAANGAFHSAILLQARRSRSG
jgi:hypothetical protein